MLSFPCFFAWKAFFLYLYTKFKSMDIKIYSDDFDQLDYLLEKANEAMFAGKAIFPCTLFVGTMINRSRALIKGFTSLIVDENYIAAIPLIRLQIDNCLICYISSKVDDIDDFIKHFLSGKDIYKYSGKTPYPLFETRIVKDLDKKFNGFEGVYREACSYIHLSAKHFHSTMKTIQNDNGSLGLKLLFGHYDGGYSDEEKEKFKVYMIIFCNLFLDLLNYWIYLQKINCEIAAQQTSTPVVLDRSAASQSAIYDFIMKICNK